MQNFISLAAVVAGSVYRIFDICKGVIATVTILGWVRIPLLGLNVHAIADEHWIRLHFRAVKIEGVTARFCIHEKYAYFEISGLPGGCYRMLLSDRKTARSFKGSLSRGEDNEAVSKHALLEVGINGQLTLSFIANAGIAPTIPTVIEFEPYHV
jgi:hypothetical protein